MSNQRPPSFGPVSDFTAYLSLAVLTILVFVSCLGVPTAKAAPDRQPVAATSIVAAAPDPVSCAGYAEPRVGVELQAWWQDIPTGEAFPGRHVHLYTCWPTGAVDGTVHLDLKLQTHAQPAGARVTRVRATDGGGSDVFPPITSGFNPIDAHGNLVQWLTRDIDTSGLSSGLHEIRLAAYVQSVNQQLVSSDLPLFVRTLSGGATSRDYVEARGWYPDFDYDNARYRTRLADFLTPKSGVWSPTFQCASPSGATADTFVVAVDPNYHALDPGIVVYSGTTETTKTVSIDTRTLADGPHKIVARCGGTHDFGATLHGINTGVLVINFTVANGTPSTPTPSPTVTPTVTPAPTPAPTPTPTPAPSTCGVP